MITPYCSSTLFVSPRLFIFSRGELDQERLAFHADFDNLTEHLLWPTSLLLSSFKVQFVTIIGHNV